MKYAYRSMLAKREISGNAKNRKRQCARVAA